MAIKPTLANYSIVTVEARPGQWIVYKDDGFTVVIMVHSFDADAIAWAEETQTGSGYVSRTDCTAVRTATAAEAQNVLGLKRALGMPNNLLHPQARRSAGPGRGGGRREIYQLAIYNHNRRNRDENESHAT